MVNRNTFDARHLRPRAPESPRPAVNHQVSPALDQVTSEGDFRPSISCHQFTAFPTTPQSQPVFDPDQFTFEGEHQPSTSCHQFTAFPAAPQSQPVFDPDQFTLEGEYHPSTSCHQFTTFPTALQFQPVFDPDQFTFEGEYHPSTSCHQFTTFPTALQFQPAFAPAPEQGRVEDNNFLFGFEEDILAQGRLPLPRSASGLTNQHSNAPTNIQSAIIRSNISPATTNPQAPFMFSDAMTDNTLLDPTTQAQLSTASSSPAPNPASTARLTIIGSAKLEILRKHNRILRSNNISIMKMKNEMEVRALAAERRVELLERELKEVRGGIVNGEEGS